MCVLALSRPNRLTYDLDIGIDVDLSYVGIVGQGRRSKVKVTMK